jgi:arabinofuranosyltransferase
VPRPTIGWALALLLIWLTGVTAPRPVLFANARYGADAQPSDAIPPSHITDERRYYYPFTGLLTARRGAVMPDHRWYRLGEEARQLGEHVALTDAAGFIAYAAGPAVHYVDRWGLGDPLLARLPANVPWEIGHYTRTIPEGYVETLQTGRNMIKDLGVAAYYDRLRIITEDPIWSRQRLLTIYRMNLGRYEHLIASYGIGRVHVWQVSTARADGSPWNAPANVIMTRGVRVDLDAPARARAVELSLSRNDDYRVELLRQDRTVYEGRISAIVGDDSSLIMRAIAVPPTVEFDAVRVEPTNGDTRYSLGHLRVVP